MALSDAKTRLDTATCDQVCDFFGFLSALTKSYQIYGADHPRTVEALADYERRAAQLARLPGIGKELVVAYHDGRFFLEHVPLMVGRQQGYLFVGHLEANGSTGFRLSLELGDKALHDVLRVLAIQPGSRKAAECGPVAGFSWLATDEVHRLESAAPRRDFDVHLLLQLPDLRIEDTVYLGAMNALSVFMSEGTEIAPKELDAVNEASDQLVDCFMASSDRIMPMTTIPYSDNLVYHHSLNVSLLTLKAASLICDSPARLKRIGQVSLLHDIGKTAIPPDVLHKPTRLTRSEADLVMRHPIIGAHRLAQFPNVDPLAAAVAFGHHIKDNGQGYPKVPSRYEIGPVTRLVEVADIFEALTAQRPYKKAMSAADAFKILYSMPNMKSFRPYVDLLVRAVGLQPVGSRVRGADGEIGVVIGHEKGDPRRPIVRPVQQESGGGYKLEEARVQNAAVGAARALGAEHVVALDSEEDFARHA